MILSDALILPVWQLQSQQVMTSLIRSRIEYLEYRVAFFSFRSTRCGKSSACWHGQLACNGPLVVD